MNVPFSVNETLPYCTGVSFVQYSNGYSMDFNKILEEEFIIYCNDGTIKCQETELKKHKRYYE